VSLHWLVQEAAAQGLLIDLAGLAAYPPDPLGELHHSLMPIWWILGWWRRFVPDQALVHESVRTRMTQRPDYRPKNLLAAQNVTFVT
jgi:hypothetical protein